MGPAGRTVFHSPRRPCARAAQPRNAYRRLFADHPMGSTCSNSTVVSLLAVVGTCCSASLAAYPLGAELRFAGRGPVRPWCGPTILNPFQVVMIPLICMVSWACATPSGALTIPPGAQPRNLSCCAEFHHRAFRLELDRGRPANRCCTPAGRMVERG